MLYCQKEKGNLTKQHSKILGKFCSLVFTQRNQKHVHTKTCTEVLRAALFITVKPGSSQEVLQSAVGKPTPEHPNNGVLLEAKKKQAIKS